MAKSDCIRQRTNLPYVELLKEYTDTDKKSTHQSGTHTFEFKMVTYRDKECLYYHERWIISGPLIFGLYKIATHIMINKKNIAIVYPAMVSILRWLDLRFR
jgi:hypothetical protein